MKILYRQTGGFAGLVKSLRLDFDELSADDRELVHSLLEGAHFFDLPEPVARAMPDEEQYAITVDEQYRSRTFIVNKSAVPEDLRPLIRYLAKRAAYEKRR